MGSVTHKHATRKMKAFAALLIASLAALVSQTAGIPMIPALIDPSTGEVLIRTTRQARDQAVAADTGYGVAPVGRVKIQTYRGPGSGYDKHVNWGYYATQPADLGKGHHHAAHHI